MSSQILIRSVPEEIVDWIQLSRKRSLLSQQQFLVSVLEKARLADYQPTLFNHVEQQIKQKQSNTIPFTFIDLFAGIGGIRLGLAAVGGKCIFSSEIDRFAQQTYKTWFDEVPKGDITKIDTKSIPDHDILAAGFPCQPFSIAGVSKKKSLGKAHGFLDLTQGTLFFHLATIAEVKRPPVLLLENVKNLRSHDKGKTWEVIRSTLEELDYVFFDKVIDGADYTPQHRERIIIVCFDKKVFGSNPPFNFPDPPQSPALGLSDILEKSPDKKYTLTDHLWNYLQEYAERHRKRGNGFGYGLADLNGVTRTLSARYYKDGSEILIPQSRGRNPRRLSPRECAKLMGFPEDLPIVVSDTQAYRQFGNAVIPAIIEAVGKKITEVLTWQLTRSKNGCLIKGGRTLKTTRRNKKLSK